MVDPNTGLELNKQAPNLSKQTPSDTLPPVDRNDVTNLDEDALRKYIYSEFSNCISDKQDYGWTDKKDYAIRAYYQVKEEAMKHWPHENASAFRPPLTPTLLDTAWANVQSGLFADPKNPLAGEGVGVEDLRPEGILLKYLNWQMVNEIKLEQESDKNVFRTFLMGTGIYKTMFDVKTNTIKVRSIDLENFFVPIDATGVQRGETDICIHLIPLSYFDIQMRKAMKIYRKPDEILPGAGLILKDSDQLRSSMDLASGMSLDTKVKRDNYYIAEIDVLGYVPPNAYNPIDLKVWMSPNGGTIQRIRKKDKMMKTPYAVAHCYPYSDRFYSMGIPEKIRPEQEKIDYTDKQFTDSADIASMPAMFIDDTESFQRGRMQRVRGGIYPKGKGNTIDWEPQPPVDRNNAQERALIWEWAERKTGVIDVTQGRPSAFGGKTLGEVEIRTARADVRFSSIFKRFGRQINEVAQIAYELNWMFVEKKRITDVIGYSAEGYTENELFPIKNGKLADFNFTFSGYLKADKEQEDDKKMRFLDSQMTSGIVANNEANTYNVSNEMAKLVGIRNFSQIVKRPKNARIIDVDEFIQRVISGNSNTQVRPGIDTDDYTFELMLYKRTPMYKNLEPFQKQLIEDALRRAFIMGVAEREEKMRMAGMFALRDQMAQMGQEGAEQPLEQANPAEMDINPNG